MPRGKFYQKTIDTRTALGDIDSTPFDTAEIYQTAGNSPHNLKKETAMTEVATTKSATTNEELVTMADGRIVAFTPKRKVVKESFIANDATTPGEVSVQVRLDFRNGETRLFTIPEGLLHKFAAHGAEQKLGDAMSGLASVEDGVMAIDELIDRLYQGEWNASRAASEFAGASVLVRALAELKSQPIDKVREFVKTKSQAERTALKNVPAVKAIIERIESEKVAKAGGVNTDELLAGL